MLAQFGVFKPSWPSTNFFCMAVPHQHANSRRCIITTLIGIRLLYSILRAAAAFQCLETAKSYYETLAANAQTPQFATSGAAATAAQTAAAAAAGTC